MIRTVDSDVLVLDIAAVQQLSIGELWLVFGSSKSLRYLPAREMASEMCIALSFVHAFSGCDTVSSFAGHGKKTVSENMEHIQ